MSFPLLRAYRELLEAEIYLQRGDFAGLHDKVRSAPLVSEQNSVDQVRRLCAAMDRACAWYIKQVLCLQRSAATVCLLRSFGVNARLVIGSQHTPFRSHAWVEVDGSVVNDKAYMREMYDVLEEC
jgi:transglutaminase superfamily protein